MKKKMFISTILIVTLMFGIAYGGFVNNDIVFRKSLDTSSTWGSPYKTTGGTAIYEAITSKWAEPRTIGTSPHWGIDIQAPSGDPKAYAVANGIAKLLTGSSYNTISQSVGNGVYVHYKHLYPVQPAITSSGVYINKGDVALGTVAGYYKGNPDYFGDHLHLGAYDSWSESNPSPKSMPISTFYRGVSAWDYGRKVDTYLKPTKINRTLSIVASFSGTYNTHNESAESVVFYYKTSPTGTWYSVAGSEGANYRWSATIPYNVSNQYIYWMARIKRQNIATSKSYVYAPAKYYNPGSNPNDPNYTFDFYTTYIN